MFSRFLLFFGAAGAGLCAAATGRRGFGARFHAKPCFFVSLAPIPGVFSATGRRGLGARFPAKPCFFVDGHHVFGVKGAAGEPDVVLHSPQNLALSSTGTTSLGPKAPPASRTWCFTPRKPLLFRRRAPRLWDQRRSAGADLVHDSSQNPVLSSTGTTSLGPKAPPASDPIIISPRGKELTTNALSLPFVVNSNHSFTPPALICILRHKN